MKLKPNLNSTPTPTLNPTLGVLCGPVSRYACRLVADRHAPYSVRLYAAGFNPQSNILLSESVPKWPIGEEGGGGVVGEEKLAEEKGASDNEAADKTQTVVQAGERGTKHLLHIPPTKRQ